MPPLVIDLRNAEDWRDVVHQTVQALVEGKLVAFPTETVYGVAASAMDERAVQRLVEVKGRRPGHALTLALKSADEAADYVPDMSSLAQRLARRCWPGPVTLVVDDSHPESLVRQLPAPSAATGRARQDAGAPRARPPGAVGRAADAGGPTGPDQREPERANRRRSRPARCWRPWASGSIWCWTMAPAASASPRRSSACAGNRYEILRAGVVPERTMQRLSSLMILFVCTGNTCRSPMAEAIARQVLARRLGCLPNELEDHGVLVMSAGIAAMLGGRASPEAVQIMTGMGLDLSGHETQPLTEPLVRHADVIYAMTRTHRETIVAQWPGGSRAGLVARGRRVGRVRPDRRAPGAVPAMCRPDPRRAGNSAGQLEL